MIIKAEDKQKLIFPYICTHTLQPKKQRKPDVSKACTVHYLSNSYHCSLAHLKVL